MGINIGGIDPVKAIIDLELRQTTTEIILEHIINGRTPTAAIIAQARETAFEQVRKKYPQLGLEKSNG